MAITDGDLAAALVDALASSGHRLAVLHREADAAKGEVSSDIDLIADVPGPELMASCRPAIQALGLSLVSIWQYDYRSTTLVFATSTATEGVQIDVVCDASGRGKYGLRTNRLLDRVVSGQRWHTLGPADAARYLLVKGSVKRQDNRIRAAEAELKGIPATESFPGAFRELGPVHSLARWVMTLGRYTRRLTDPPGFWVHIEQEGLQDEVYRRFARFMPYAHKSNLTPATWARAHIARLRAGIYVTQGGRAHFADMVLKSGLTADEATRLIVSKMSQRYWRARRVAPWVKK